MSVSLPWGIAAGIAAMIAVLIAANHWLQRRPPDGSVPGTARGAVAGLAVATPVALISGFVLGLRAYDVGTAGGDGTPYGLVALFLPFVLWSLGFWIGLQWRVRQDQ